ncbi:defensin/CCP-like protein [Trifolium medium]|uniref:Defensin/CCP-like protein n=1 Tax=Trifolium medium TaxID=97028 RepID=A0A392LY15_9FABA|nr:defensin/CCP-like protein [Trifolium medium]
MIVRAFKHFLREVISLHQYLGPVEVDMIVLTNGSRILGLGDLGVLGIGILDVYVAAASFNPQSMLLFMYIHPVMLDVGTNNQKLLGDRLSLSFGEPEPLLALLDSGTAGVVLAGLLGTVRSQGRSVSDFVSQKIVVVGAGRSAKGVSSCNSRDKQRLCVKHLYGNWRKKYPGIELKESLWMAARATTVPAWERAMQRMKALNEKAWKYMMDVPSAYWTRSHFKTNTRWKRAADRTIPKARNKEIDDLIHIASPDPVYYATPEPVYNATYEPVHSAAPELNHSELPPPATLTNIMLFCNAFCYHYFV